MRPGTCPASLSGESMQSREFLKHSAPMCYSSRCQLVSTTALSDLAVSVIHIRADGSDDTLRIPADLVNDVDSDIYQEEVVPWLKTLHLPKAEGWPGYG